MISDKTRRRVRGRPRKPPGTKLQQFSVRLNEPSMLGLDLIASIYRISRSYAVELSLHAALRQLTTKEGTRLETVCSALLSTSQGPERLMLLYRICPAALSDTDLKTCQLAYEGLDISRLKSELVSAGVDPPDLDSALDQQYWPVIFARWEEVQAIALEAAQDRSRPDGMSLAARWGINEETSLSASYRLLSEALVR